MFLLRLCFPPFWWLQAPVLMTEVLVTLRDLGYEDMSFSLSCLSHMALLAMLLGWLVFLVMISHYDPLLFSKIA